MRKHNSMVTMKGYKGKVFEHFADPSLIERLKEIFSNDFKTVTPITTRRDRPVFRFSSGGKNYYIKRYFSKGIKALAKSTLGISSAERALTLPAHLLSFGVATPDPVGFFRKQRSFFEFETIVITKEVPDPVSLRGYVQKNIYGQKLSRQERWRFFDHFARFVAGIHRAGVYHGDFTSDNILLSTTGIPPFTFYLIDLDAVRSIGAISTRRRIKNLDEIGRNFMDFSRISLTDRARVVRSYLRYYKRSPVDFKPFLKKIAQRTQNRIEKRMRKS